MKGIYYIKNLKNNKIYIGQSLNIERRIKRHIRELKNEYHHNKHLQKSFKKYGIDNFEFNVLEITDNLNEREMYWIKYYNSINPLNGYNKTYGGDSEEPNDETKLKLSKAFKGKPKSEEHKKNLWMNREKKQTPIVNKVKIKSSGMKGKKHSEETKLKLSKASKGRKHTDESKLKISKALKGKKHSEETKLKISNSGKGRKMSEEHKNKLIEINSKRIRTSDEKEKISKALTGKKLSDDKRKSHWKASDELVIEVIKLLNKGYSVLKISKELNVSRNFVNAIKIGKTYTHIDRNIY